MELNTGALNTGVLNGSESIGIREAFTAHGVGWGTSAQRRHVAPYQSRCSRGHTAIYRSEETLHAHRSRWSLTGSRRHRARYTVPAWNGTSHSTQWSSFIETSTHHLARWSAFSVSAFSHHAARWTSGRREASTHHLVEWTSRRLASAKAHHQVSWASLNALTFAERAHRSGWVYSPSAQVIHVASWKSVVDAHRAHRCLYTRQDRFARSHTARYHSFSTDAGFLSGSIFIATSQTTLDFLSMSISTDEESPYYQCEMTLKDSRDYVLLKRDTPFVIQLLEVEYHFIVDTRSLTRSIDDSGNYVETCSLTGLSPLVKWASPRSKKITQTWTEATRASSIVEELLGSITWNLVDWTIPAYRLAAEKAAPLDIATQIVSTVGGLIESQPDGSVVCRPRWPVSWVDWTMALPDQVLDERRIFSADESPTNDDLINRVRILDQEAGYQDRLEYVPNKMGDHEDHFHGFLYAFPSPWREGLRLVTTRPSAVQLGPLSEGTRVIQDTNADYPAEILTFAEGTSSTQYPVMELTAVEWLDEDLGGVVATPYATTLTASGSGTYSGYSLAKISYVTRYLKVPVTCLDHTQEIEAQCLLLEKTND